MRWCSWCKKNQEGTVAVGTVDGDCAARHYYACEECRDTHRIVPLSKQRAQRLDGSPQYYRS
ncbi:hypothetical protein ACFQ2B_29190 [Streptomyces stramineus]|uniref:Uncharacterized protein n=1 Tax=Streptomyces stramineus TaxID=173861 RepID=A0ABN1BLR8_9ACTN